MRLLYLITLTVIFSLVTAPESYGKVRRLNIIYTGGLIGQLEPCGCSPKTDFGGIPRIAGFLDENREALAPYILVDAGNFAGKDTHQGKLKAEAMIRAFSIIGYDAVALQSNETSFPENFINPLLKSWSIPALSQNNGTVVIDRSGFTINISADEDSVVMGKTNILLTERPASEVKAVKGWDVIISSAGEESESPLYEGKTAIVSGFPKGKKLGILSLAIDSKGEISFDHKWQPVGNNLSESKSVRSVLNDYDKKVANLMKEQERPPAGTTYAGVDKCAECHQPFYDTWKDSSHAHAFETLEPPGKTADPECVVCHVVGYGEEGGFYSIESTPKLANVQCESCHGLDREHLTDYSKPLKTVTESDCLKCHTRENSPDFDYPSYLEIIKHWE